jgi:hypothetical protein
VVKRQPNSGSGSQPPVVAIAVDQRVTDPREMGFRTRAGRTSGYDAFVSYSHALDGALARALQTGLERFAKPCGVPKVGLRHLTW